MFLGMGPHCIPFLHPAGPHVMMLFTKARNCRARRSGCEEVLDDADVEWACGIPSAKKEEVEEEQ